MKGCKQELYSDNRQFENSVQMMINMRKANINVSRILMDVVENKIKDVMLYFRKMMRTKEHIALLLKLYHCLGVRHLIGIHWPLSLPREQSP